MKKLLIIGLPILIALVLLQPTRGYAQTAAQLQDLINALLIQVSQLQSQLNAAQSSKATSTPALTVVKAGTGSGTVTGQGINCGSDCTENYASGTSVALNASASTGSIFNSWSGCNTASGTACTVVMNFNKTVTATFNSTGTSTLYTLTVNKSGTGTGTVTGQGINCGSDCSENYQPNRTVILTATANNSIFGGWSGCGANSSSTTCTVQMTGNKSVTAAFNANTSPSISNISGPINVLFGAAGTWNVTVTDPDGNLNILLVDWGDGASDSAGVSGNVFTRYFAHKYDTEGSKTINFTVLDKASGSYSRSVSVMVRQPVKETAFLDLAGSLFQLIQEQINQITIKLVDILNEVFKVKGLR